MIETGFKKRGMFSKQFTTKCPEYITKKMCSSITNMNFLQFVYFPFNSIFVYISLFRPSIAHYIAVKYDNCSLNVTKQGTTILYIDPTKLELYY